MHSTCAPKLVARTLSIYFIPGFSHASPNPWNIANGRAAASGFGGSGATSSVSVSSGFGGFSATASGSVCSGFGGFGAYGSSFLIAFM